MIVATQKAKNTIFLKSHKYNNNILIIKQKNTKKRNRQDKTYLFEYKVRLARSHFAHSDMPCHPLLILHVPQK